MMIINMIAAAFIAALAGLGIGGGGLLVLYLVAVREMGQLSAQGCNLLFFVFSSVAAMFVHRNKRKLDFKLIGILALLAIVGSQIGVHLTGILPEETVRHLYGWMLLTAGAVTGIKVILKK